MKVALVYDAVYPFVKGGGEKRFYEIAKRLSERGHEVHLYGMKFWKGPDVIKKDGFYVHGICKAKKLYTKEGKRSIFEAVYFGLSCFKLLKEDFDYIDCCGFPYFSLFPAWLSCKLKGKKLNSTWHEIWGKNYWFNYIGGRGVVGYLVEKISSKLPDRIIAVSEHTKKKFISNFGKKDIVVVENGIDV
jgi:hypothetical protein